MGPKNKNTPAESIEPAITEEEAAPAVIEEQIQEETAEEVEPIESMSVSMGGTRTFIQNGDVASIRED